jgi:hypothetical protein
MVDQARWVICKLESRVRRRKSATPPVAAQVGNGAGQVRLFFRVDICPFSQLKNAKSRALNRAYQNADNEDEQAAHNDLKGCRKQWRVHVTVSGSHSFTKLFTLLRAAPWREIDRWDLLRFCGTAGLISVFGDPQHAYFPRFAW